MKATLVLPGGPKYPDRWGDSLVGAPHWGITEWGFHVCFDDGSRNTGLDDQGQHGKILSDMRDAKINGVRQNYKIRITRDPSWPGQPSDPLKFAAELSKDITYLGQDGKQCAFGIDYEKKDGDWILAALKEIRRLRTGRGVMWMCEPNQGGWIKNYPELVKFINSDPLVFVVGQTYDKNMVPYGSADGVRVNLWDAGIMRDAVELYYGKNDKPDPTRWSGLAYDWNNWV